MKFQHLNLMVMGNKVLIALEDKQINILLQHNNDPFSILLPIHYSHRISIREDFLRKRKDKQILHLYLD